MANYEINAMSLIVLVVIRKICELFSCKSDENVRMSIVQAHSNRYVSTNTSSSSLMSTIWSDDKEHYTPNCAGQQTTLCTLAVRQSVY